MKCFIPITQGCFSLIKTMSVDFIDESQVEILFYVLLNLMVFQVRILKNLIFDNRILYKVHLVLTENSDCSFSSILF